ncbi:MULTISPECIES: hypothetical protein [Nocardiaceae]|uniref:hypothetical protein n=1 Tax=Nocardiaceae TaxID=85025 RepID=UPI00050C24A4|nr:MULTISPECIES: hypothetical protein [Rhodococcus]KQU29544.1 hypothetical protein ASH04_17415 [Rhodococcus sp. Leaf233]
MTDTEPSKIGITSSVGQSDSARTRRALLTAAADLINIDGTVTITGLTTGTGLTRGAVYVHFDSKTELILGVIDAADEQLRAAYAPEAAVERHRDAAAIMKDFLDRLAADRILRATCTLWTDRDFARAARAATREPLRHQLIDALARTHRSPYRDPTTIADLLIAVITARIATAGDAISEPRARAATAALIDEVLR